MGRVLKKITQKKAAFYILWKSYRQSKSAYVPAWKFVGEMYIEELGVHFLMSYKGPTNGLNIYFDNPRLVERRETRGPSGARYYEYRLAPLPSVDKIDDPDLKNFYQQLKEGQRRMSLRPIIPEKQHELRATNIEHQDADHTDADPSYTVIPE